jgi:Phosphatidylinositol 3- and 4-kinase.
MKVTVIEYHNGGTRRVFEGEAQDIVQNLLSAYPWLVSAVRGDKGLESLVAALDASQAYTALVQDSDINLIKSEQFGGNSVVDQFLGQHVKWEKLLAAASFLSGRTPSAQDVRRALVLDEENLEAAALHACDLESTKANLEALQSILVASLSKAEPEPDEKPVEIKEVVPVTQDAIPFAEGVIRASKDGAVFTVRLGTGKHVAGTMLAWDSSDDKRYLLKLGSGKQNPAAGMNESGVSQSKREVAYSQIARAWGLGEYVPEAHLLLLDGKEYAAMEMLSLGYKNLNTLRSNDITLPKRLFMLFTDGTLQKWAALDYILGNVDSHSGNIMVNGDKVFLIDHGSAFAGKSFSPAVDQFTFTPAYLRALAPANYKRMSQGDKLRALPRINEEQAKKLGNWIRSLDEKVLAELCYKYGIDPAPEIDRLNSLKSMCGFESADLAVNSCWCL